MGGWTFSRVNFRQQNIDLIRIDSRYKQEKSDPALKGINNLWTIVAIVALWMLALLTWI